MVYFDASLKSNLSSKEILSDYLLGKLALIRLASEMNLPLMFSLDNGRIILVQNFKSTLFTPQLAKGYIFCKILWS